MDNFDLKKFLTENRLTSVTRNLRSPSISENMNTPVIDIDNQGTEERQELEIFYRADDMSPQDVVLRFQDFLKAVENYIVREEKSKYINDPDSTYSILSLGVYEYSGDPKPVVNMLMDIASQFTRNQTPRPDLSDPTYPRVVFTPAYEWDESSNYN